MDKDKDNLCKHALIAGKNTYNGEDQLAECINMFKDLKISCTSEGNHRKAEITNSVWHLNDKDIATLLDEKNLENNLTQKTKKLPKKN